MKLSVVSEGGKEAVVAILGPGDFFDEGRSARSHGDGCRDYPEHCARHREE